MRADFSLEIWRPEGNLLKVLKEKKKKLVNPEFFSNNYLGNEGEIKVLSNKGKLRWFIVSRYTLQEI